ncbi:MAG TPA: aminopeptidase P family protein [Firmicutes bacterium]|jgi:Xaa-Pro aminopeptidase|nr:aminopeptidase P family protein [Bacillota bacterium]
MDNQIITNRLAKLRSKMDAHDIAAILFTHPPNIFYLSGFSGSSAFLCITERAAHLYTDFRYLQQAAEESPLFEIIKVGNSDDFGKIITFLHKSGIKNLAVEEASLTLQRYNKLQAVAQGIELIAQSNFVEEIRAIKEKGEVEKIASAARIADQAFLQLLPLIRPGMREDEIALELEYRLRKAGSQKNPFDIIVASGPRSALPHGLPTGKVIAEGELITIDFGAVWGRYCSDMTRTFLLGEPRDKKQSEIYNVVREAQKQAISQLQTGRSCAEIDAIARNLFQEFDYAVNFGHGLGHGVGLEVHEFPTLSPRGKAILEEGMVFTVEPGLYFEGWGGVRIEDMIVLQDGGFRVLTSSPKELVV